MRVDHIREARAIIQKLAEFDLLTDATEYTIWKKRLKKALAEDLLHFIKEREGNWDDWSANVFDGEVVDEALDLLHEGDDKFGMEKSSDAFKEIVEELKNPKDVLAAKKKKKEPKKPKKVKEIADAIRRDNKGVSDEVAYRQAWETYCSYVNKNYHGCTQKGKSKRKSPKSEY